MKGLSAAETIVKPGGLIIGVAECRDGFPDHRGLPIGVDGGSDGHDRILPVLFSTVHGLIIILHSAEIGVS